jgi:hypothetical protein
MSNTNTANRVSNRQKNFNFGYRAGLRGDAYRPELSKYPGYDEGWDGGNSDRPSLDDLALDVASERSNPLGY